MSTDGPVEVAIIQPVDATEGRLKTYRGWICGECAAVVADLQQHSTWHLNSR